MNLNDKVCVITGAGKGIGFTCAQVFSEHGAKIAVISRSQEDLIKLKSELNLNEDRFYMMSGDVSSPEVVSDFVANVIEKYKKIDVLINNAGMRFRKPFLDIAYHEWKNVIDVNAGSTFLMCQEVGRHMISKKRGKIINMASIVGTLGLPELSGYAASKGAIISLSKSLALEWAEHNINVNVIAPGFCETSYADAFKQKTDLYTFTLDRTPMKKWGQSIDIANGCLYLASSLSDYVTGEVLSIDGGWSCW